MSKNAKRFKKRKSLRNPFKIHGGKHYLKWWIIDEFPENYHELDYRELFGGAASVLLNKKESVTELLNDLCESRYHLHVAIRDNVHQLIDCLNNLEYCEETFEHFRDSLKNESGTLTSLEIAVAEYAVRRMSRGGLGKSFAWQERLRGGQPGSLNEWKTSIPNLYKVSKRLQNVSITCNNALTPQLFNGNALLYLDPPYLPDTRTSKKAYENEMTKEQHEELLTLCVNSSCKILLSGYDNDLYNQCLVGWNKVTKDVPNHSGQNSVKNKRKEVLWRNY